LITATIMEHLRGEKGQLPTQNPDESPKKRMSGREKSPTRAFFFDCCKFIKNAIEKQSLVEVTRIDEYISVDNFEKAIIKQFMVNEEGDKTIVWRTKKSRMTQYLGVVLTIDGALLTSMDLQNQEHHEQPHAVIIQDDWYYHRLGFLSEEQKVVYTSRCTRDHFGTKVTSASGKTNNLHLLYFRLILNNFRKHAKTELENKKGKKKNTILQNILSADVIDEQYTPDGCSFDIFFSSKEGSFTDFKKNFKAANTWMTNIENWFTYQMEAKWKRYKCVGQLAIKNKSQWNTMITKLKDHPSKPITFDLDEEMTTLWDNCDLGLKQIKCIDNPVNWSGAVTLFEEGVQTNALVKKLIKLKELWIWARVLVIFSNEELHAHADLRLGGNFEALMRTLSKYARTSGKDLKDILGVDGLLTE
jgi:hypothetical protein